MGLYGNILVIPSEPDYWPPTDRDLVLTLDDILIEDGKVAPFSPSRTYAAMGRFGNLMLVGGETDYRATARVGEVVRLWLTNTANTRVFNVRLPGVRMKLVGGDSGRVERTEFVDEVLLAPSERAVVDDHPGELSLEHRTRAGPIRWPPFPSPTSRCSGRWRPSSRRSMRRPSWPRSSRSKDGWPRRPTRPSRWSPKWTTWPAARTGALRLPDAPEVIATSRAAARSAA